MTELWRRLERWIKHYSSGHSILLVGEGDFSFSYCLATAFGSATNIVATSFDTYDGLIEKYRNAYANLAVLEIMGATLLHGVDATLMRSLPDLQSQKFHRVVYNFPHAGFHRKEDNPDLILMHRNLVRGFLMNASTMLLPDGEIHVNHKITAPFDSWKIEDLAAECSLLCVGQDYFRIEDYPGYQNKRGSGSRPDEPFPLGECITFRFKLLYALDVNFRIPVGGMKQQPVSVQTQSQPQYDDVSLSDGLTLRASPLNECRRIFGRYLDHVDVTFGSRTTYDDVCRSVREALRVGYEMYMDSGSGQWRPLSGYIDILEELRGLSILRSEILRQWLSHLDPMH
ncbi:hypothetical protein OROGR_001345 [Orobanche gracilis]